MTFSALFPASTLMVFMFDDVTVCAVHGTAYDSALTKCRNRFSGVWDSSVGCRVYIPLPGSSHAAVTKKNPAECMRICCDRPDAVVSQSPPRFYCFHPPLHCRNGIRLTRMPPLGSTSDSPRQVLLYRGYGLRGTWNSSGK